MSYPLGAKRYEASLRTFHAASKAASRGLHGDFARTGFNLDDTILLHSRDRDLRTEQNRTARQRRL